MAFHEPQNPADFTALDKSFATTDEKGAFHFDSLGAGQYVVAVTPENEPKLFQPFFTTKPVGKGTGLGLSISYGIIDSYGGVIGCHGNDWGGATFFFELPVTEVSEGRPVAAASRAS